MNPASTVVDLKPFIDVGVQCLQGVLMALGSWTCAWAVRHFAVLRTKQASDALHDGLDRAVNYAIAVAQRAGNDHRSLDTRNALVLDAVSYAKRYLPDAVKRFGLDSGDIEHLVLAHLPDLSPPAAAVAAPPATAVVATS
ncbi:MAG TPA: hypothetical protein VN970_07370, partial [Thermoanaerobaculia bacterium]|nr:hypothetical protein [Thermoanaerobaculia bacterium]